LTSARRRRLVTGALVLALVRPGSAAALDVKLWPLFRYASDPARDELRWTAFGPVIEFRRTAESRDLRIRPLLWLHQRRGAQHDDRADILYPLLSTRWTEDYQLFRFLLFAYRSAPPPGAAHPPEEAPPPERWARRLTLLPFVFYRASPERGVQLSVFPFYADIDDFLGYDHIAAVMFPAYLRLSEPGLERRYYAFPFVSTLGGASGRGFRVWPFYGTSEIAGRERTRYVLWPFHIRSEHLVPGYGWEHRRLNFPVFAAIDGAGRHTRSYGLVFIHTVDERRGIEHTGAPWPFVVRQRRLGESDYQVWRMMPFYGQSDSNGISSRTYAWPAYRTKQQDVEDFHYERRDVGLLLWRRQTVYKESSGRRERLLTTFPVLRSEEDEGRRSGQIPALMDSLAPKNRGILGLWAPLYGLLRWDTRPDGAEDWNLLWGLAAREDGHLLGPWHLELGPPAGDGTAHGG